MNITLWVLQVVLGAVFLAHGWLLLGPPPEIAAQMTAELPRWFWVFLGVAEVLAAVGLTVAGVVRGLSRAVVAAAIGVTFVMISATIWHLVRGEFSSAAITAVLLAMAVFTAYGRWRLAPLGTRRLHSSPA